MRRALRRLIAPAAALLAVGFALGAGPGAGRAQHVVATADTLHPRIRYPDSLLSANDRCMVSQAKLNPKVRPVYVNGVPMGFC